MAKLPAIQFYTDDWLSDFAVRSVSYAARGLWADMLCLMNHSDPRGYLRTPNGKPISLGAIAAVRGGTVEEVESLSDELSNADVYSVDENGVIFSRRMVRDEELRQRNRKNGSMGGNPSLVSGLLNPRLILDVNPWVIPDELSRITEMDNPPLKMKMKMKESSEGGAGGNIFDGFPAHLRSRRFVEAWAELVASRKGMGKPMNSSSANQMMKRFSVWGEDKSIEAIENSLANGWQGVFEPKRNRDDIPNPTASERTLKRLQEKHGNGSNGAHA